MQLRIQIDDLLRADGVIFVALLVEGGYEGSIGTSSNRDGDLGAYR